MDIDIKKLEQIADYYGTEKSRYRRNEKYPKGGHGIFTTSQRAMINEL